MTDADTFEARARRIDAARRAVAALDPEPRGAGEELVRALEEHQAAVLRAVVARLRADDRGRELLYELVDDPEVYAALVKAGIVRPSLAMRALQVLDGLRPYMTSHGGDVELVRIADGVAFVRLTGACESCSSSSSTLRDLVAEALLEHLPELHAVEEDAPVVVPAFIPVSAVGLRRRDDGR
jgi:Fe-S cluster biogenesis protein NfuA